MTVIERIDELRNMRGWSINYLAMEAMLTQSTLNNLYSRRAEPKLSTLRSICGAFHISLSEFFNGVDGESTETAEEKELRNRIASLNKKEKEALLILLRARSN